MGHIISRWNHMKLHLKSNKDFKNGDIKGEYHQIHDIYE